MCEIFVKTVNQPACITVQDVLYGSLKIIGHAQSDHSKLQSTLLSTERHQGSDSIDGYSPIIIGWGSLFTPIPALVLAATSTRYWIPGNKPPITTDRMAASTVLLIWNRVSFPRHQIYRKETVKSSMTSVFWRFNYYNWIHTPWLIYFVVLQNCL